MTPERLRKYLNITHSMGASMLLFLIDGTDFEPDQDEIHIIIREIVPELIEKTPYLKTILFQA